MSGVLLVEYLVLLLSDLVEELASADVLHDQVNVLLIDIGLVVFDDVRVIELCEDADFLLNCV